VGSPAGTEAGVDLGHLASVLTSAPLRKISGAAQDREHTTRQSSRIRHIGLDISMVGPKVHAHGASGPVTKRQKVQVDGEKDSSGIVRQSKIFAPFRVCNYTFTTIYF
jgi:hypothetical protein